jgi:nicotinate-nucleotide pyrophosphorylase (carboxylating)
VEKLREAKLNVIVACTRKTGPGLEYFDKKAVLVGGGDTHRLHLDDMILIKTNHIALVGNCEKAISKARQKASFSKKIEVEVANAEDALRAARAGADIIMLDNFSIDEARKTCAVLREAQQRHPFMIEASGGIDSENVVEYASTGVNIVSLGDITQSPAALDISMKITKATRK